MNRALSALLFLVCLSMTAISQPSRDVFPFPVVQRKLSNGLTVLAVPTGLPDIVALQIPVRVGSRNEVEPGRSGFAHFFEHMMFRGTKRFSSDAYNEALKRAGADSNAYTTDDFTNYHTTFSKDDLETVLMLEADRFMNLDYSLPAFQTEARAVLGEYNKNYSDPLDKLLEAQRDAAFQTHTYKHTTMGFLRDIERMPEMFDYSRQFFDRFYRPERSTLIVAGDIVPDEVFQLVEKHWGMWKPGSFIDTIPAEPAPAGAIRHHVPWDTATPPFVTVAFRGPAASDREPDMAALSALASLAFGPSSDLYRKLVIEDQVVDQLMAYFPDRRDPYLLTVIARVLDVGHIERVREAIQDTCAQLRETTLDADRVAALRSRTRYGFATGLDNTESIAEALVPYVALYGDWTSINRSFALVETLTPEILQDVARQWFRDDSMVVTTLAQEVLDGPPGSVEASRAAPGTWAETPFPHLLKPSSSPIIDFKIVIPAGAAHDSRPGETHFVARCVAEGGSENRTYAEIQQLLFPMAASFTVQVDKEMTVFSGRVHQDHADAYWEIVSDQLFRPGFRTEDVDRIKKTIINEIRTDLRANNDEELAKEVLYQTLFSRSDPSLIKSPVYRHLTAGNPSDLQLMDSGDVSWRYQNSFRDCWEPRWLVMTGGFRPEFAARLIRDLEAWKDPMGGTGVYEIREEVEELTLEPPLDVTIVQKDTRATALSFGFPIEVTRNHPDFAGLWLATSWLGEHRSSNSHLFQRMREIRGMNYGDYAYIEYFPRGMFQFHPDPNLCRKQQIFQIWVRPVPPEQAVFALKIAKYELDRLIRDGLTEEQFASTRDYLVKFLPLLVKSQDRQIGYDIDSRWYGMGPFVPTMREALKNLTRDEVNRIIKKHLSYQQLAAVFVTQDAESLRGQLLSAEPAILKYDSPKPAEILEEDRMIGALPLHLDDHHIRIVPVNRVFE